MARAGSFIGTPPRCSPSRAANFATPSSYSSCHGCGRWDLMSAGVVNTWESTEMRRSDTRPPDSWWLIVTTMARGVPLGNTDGARGVHGRRRQQCAHGRRVAPVYHNADNGFWALTRFDDVLAGLSDPGRFSSAQGTLIEQIQSAQPAP